MTGERKKSLLALLVLIFFFGTLLWLLFDTHVLKTDSYGNLYTGESTFGDLPFHLSSIAQMAYGDIFPPENPFLAGKRLVYPYFINLLSVFLVKVGFSLRDSILLPGMFFSIQIIIFLYFFYRKITKDVFSSFLGITLFWLNGGLGFYYFLKDVVFGKLMKSFLVDPTRFPDYTHVFSENIQWPNFLTRIIVPERSILLGVPLGLLTLYLLFVDVKKRNSWLRLVIAAIAFSLLPLSHTHTFLVFALILPVLALWELKKLKLKNWFLRWFVFGIIVFLVAMPQLNLILGHLFEGGGFFRFHIGWMSKPGLGNLLIFWFKNSGFALPLVVLYLFLEKRTTFLKKLVFCAIIIFIITNLFLFQPYNWDNVKFLFWFGIFTSPAIAYVLIFFWKQKHLWGKMLSAFFFVSLVFSSIPSIYREIRVRYQLFSAEEVVLAKWIRFNTPKPSIFLTAPIHNSFVGNLAGRRILMGYPGNLWVHGISYQKQETDLKNIYAGVLGTEDLLLTNNIGYIVIGPREINDLRANLQYFMEHDCLIKETASYKIFEVGRCLHNVIEN